MAEFVIETTSSKHVFRLDESGKLFTMRGTSEYRVTRLGNCVTGKPFRFFGKKVNPYTGELDSSETFFQTAPVVSVSEI